LQSFIWGASHAASPVGSNTPNKANARTWQLKLWNA
jgi:hypothetical protein